MERQSLKRSKSFPKNKRVEDDHSNRSQDVSQCLKDDLFLCNEYVEPDSQINSLKEEIVELQKRLQSEFDVRNDLENALAYRNASQEGHIFIPKLATELIKEIAVLELEISHLEQYILSLYRKAFDQQTSVYLSQSSKPDSSVSPNSTLGSKCQDFLRTYETPKVENPDLEFRCFSFDDRFKAPSLTEIRGCQSLLNQQCTFDNKISSPKEEYIGNRSSIDIRISDHKPKMTPNKLSEKMIKFAANVYYNLADTRCRSSISDKTSDFDDQFTSSEPYNAMIEVTSIKRKGLDFEIMLLHFRELINQLKDVDPRKLKHQEKLAFWINVHNALVMHTFLVNGIPQNNVKKFWLLSKPAYNIGGRVMSIETLQKHILLSQMPRPKQWLQLILAPKKLRTRKDQYREYALEYPEPLMYFALCSGNHSDPPVRVYKPQSIYLELETAKEEFICATFGFISDKRLILPKIIKSFSKDSNV